MLHVVREEVVGCILFCSVSSKSFCLFAATATPLFAEVRWSYLATDLTLTDERAGATAFPVFFLKLFDLI